MAIKIFVKPKRKGLIVIKPDGSRLGDAGEWVEESIFWQRRLNAKEVEIINPKKGK